jgi:protein O-mannosyl-transferase
MLKTLDKFLRSPKNLYIGLLLPVILVYFKSLKFGFTTLDEQWLILKGSAYLNDWNNVAGSFTVPIAGVYFRPIFIISLIVDHHLGQVSPFIYHFTNLIWHLAAVLLLYKFLLLLDLDRVKAFLFSLLFGLHPIMVHAVAWVPGRNDSMLCVFALSSFICLLKFLRTGQKKFIVLHSLAFSLALLTKESAIVFPVIYLVMILMFGKHTFKANIPVVLIISLISLGYLWVHHKVAASLPANSTEWFLTIKNFFLAFLMYAGKAVIPIKQSIMPNINMINVVCGIVVMALVILFFAKKLFADRKMAAFGFLIFVVGIVLPVWFGVSQGAGTHYEHRMYTSMVGIMIMASQIKLKPDGSNYSYALIVILLIFGIKTTGRMNVYKDDEAFVEAGTKERPDHYLFFVQRGAQLEGVNDALAIEFYNKALELRPGYGIIYKDRGMAFLSTNNFKEAIADFNKATQLIGYDEMVYVNRCYSYLRMSDANAAKRDLDTLGKYSPQAIDPQLKTAVMEMWNKLQTAE